MSRRPDAEKSAAGHARRRLKEDNIASIPPVLIRVFPDFVGKHACMHWKSILSSSKTKRWHGNVDALKPDFLKGVLGQMESYGDRVRFGLIGSVKGPHYEVINSYDKKMAFNGNHHLHHPEEGEFELGNVTTIYSMEQIKRFIAGGGSGSTRSSAPRAARSTTRSSSAGAARPMTAAARAKEAIDSEKYAYYKANRHMLPEGINQYSNDISDLMTNGMSAEQAFGKIIEEHFD